jgi:hypothetical protein
VSKGSGTTASRSGVQLTDGDAFSPSDVIHPLRARIGTSMTQIAAEVSSVVIALRWQPDPIQVTVPSRAPIVAPDSQCLGSIFSQISMATYLKLCSKILDQGCDYNFVIAAIAKFLSNQV